MIQVPSGPITRARAKKLQGLIEEAVKYDAKFEEMKKRMELQEDQRQVNIIQASEDLAPKFEFAPEMSLEEFAPNMSLEGAPK